jgi:hypothetical protein
MAADRAIASTALQQATRESYAMALAELAAAARSSNPCLAAALEAEKKPAKRQQLEKTAGSMFKAALITPFVEAAVAGNKVAYACQPAGWFWPVMLATPSVCISINVSAYSMSHSAWLASSLAHIVSACMHMQCASPAPLHRQSGHVDVSMSGGSCVGCICCRRR